MSEYVLRFIFGGLLVSLFAIIGDVVRPKSFAGLLTVTGERAFSTFGSFHGQHLDMDGC